MGLISLLVKAFLLFVLFNMVMGLYRLYRAFRLIKKSGGQASYQFGNFENQQTGPFQQGRKGSPPNQNNADVFEAEYKVVDSDKK